MRPLPFTTGDLMKISHLQPEGWKDIVPQFRNYLSERFCFPAKKLIDRKIAGIGCAIRFETSGWLAHIIVDPGLRNRGIGTEITKHLVDLLLLKGCTTIQLIATDAGEPVYRKLGFRNVTRYDFFEGKCTRVQDAGLIIQYDHRFKKEILQIDRLVSGEDRKVLLNNHFSSMKIYVTAGNVLGFFAPDLGEGLIAATDGQAGKALLSLKHAGNHIRTALPADNDSANEFFSMTGFRLVRSALRMSLGKDLVWHPDLLYSRIGGNLG